MRIGKNYKYQGQPVGPELVGKHIIWIVWGECPDFSTMKRAIEEQSAAPYIFDTKGELNAFIRGINESQGWEGYYSSNTEKGAINEYLNTL